MARVEKEGGLLKADNNIAEFQATVIEYGLGRN